MTRLSDDDRIWRNARLATFDPTLAQPYGLLEVHALMIRDGRRRARVLEAELSASSKTVDLGGRFVTPGLIDCHSHLIFGVSRPLARRPPPASGSRTIVFRPLLVCFSPISATASRESGCLPDVLPSQITG